MTGQPTDLRSLSRTPTMVPRPRKRLGTRVLLPLGILLAALSMFAYAARDAFIPSVHVWVMPVVLSESTGSDSSAAEAAPTVLVQAPGWIEPNPYAVTVQALAEGVISDVLVLEGQLVQADQVVAKMIDADARLGVRSADADFEARLAELERANAEHKAAEARAAELRDEVERKRTLVETGGISAGQLARLELRLSAADRDTDAAKAAIGQAEALVKTHRVMCEEARLRHSRMEVRAPIAGVVMQRLVEPGTRMSMNAPTSEGASMGIVRLYDPSKLQARVDVPLADAGKVALGTRAEIEAEIAPGTIFKGEVIRLVHEANIQRNTVQFKVGIQSPSPALKPEMLTRVRFIGVASDPMPAAGNPSAPSESTLIDAALVRSAPDGSRFVWTTDRAASAAGPVASRRTITIAGAGAGRVRVLTGLHTGDRLILDPPADLREHARLTILGEKGDAAP